MQIYAVTEGEDSDSPILALFSSREGADAFINTVRGNRIEIYELDPPDVDMLHRGYQIWYVSMKRDGTVLYTDKNYFASFIEKQPMITLSQHLWAKSAAHAIKMLNEKRAQFIAEGKWPE